MLESLRVRTALAFLILTAATSTLVFIATRSTWVEIVVASVAAGGLGVLLITLLMRPLGRMAAAARRIAAGDLSARVSPRPGGELGDVADAFNQMAQSVESLVATASQERSRLMAALNSSSDAVLAVDREGIIRFANVAAERLLAGGRGGLLGSALAWALPNQEAVDALAASRAGSKRETRTIERPGRQHYQLIVTPIVGGGDWFALVVLHDISEVKRIEHMRRDFVANVSHELRTPLASIKAVLETLERGALEDPQAARDFISRADDEVERLVLLVEELLELSRIESGDLPIQRKPVEMARLVERVAERLRPLAEKLEVALDVEVVGDTPLVEGDESLLERAVLNLVQNALKFTDAGGKVELQAAREDGQAVVRVKDTGVGIDPADLPRIFERFYKADHSRRSGGTGLGLAVVKHAVEAHGGHVTVESELGHGSTFTMWLPLHTPELANSGL
jgi:two-component system phosphate regulon sensor histidine kinase PhoR